MPRVDPVLIKDWNTLAAALNPTPYFNAAGEIEPLGAEGPKGKTYVVWVGRAVGLFNNWGLTSSMVTAFPGAIHKSYTTLTAAREAWHEGPSHLPNWKPPGPHHTAPTLQPEATLRAANEGHEAPIKAQPTLIAAAAIPVRLPSHIPMEASTGPSAEGGYPLTRTPSISSVSSVSSVSSTSGFSSVFDDNMRPRPSVLTADTLSDYDVLSPALTELSLDAPAPSTPRRVKSSALGSPRPTPPPSALSTPVSMQRWAGKRPANAQGDTGLDYDKIPVRKGKKVFVVVRGDRPGVYFDRSTALVNAGWNPGMKIVVFKSLSHACWYFVQRYMQKQVGVPAIEVSDSEGDDE